MVCLGSLGKSFKFWLGLDHHYVMRNQPIYQLCMLPYSAKSFTITQNAKLRGYALSFIVIEIEILIRGHP